MKPRSKLTFRRHMDDLVAGLSDRVRAVCADCDVDAAHDARVVSRRLKAAIDLLRPAIDESAWRRLARLTRRLRRSLGPLRDVDVMLDHLRQARPPATSATAVPWMAARLQQRRDELRVECRARLSAALVRKVRLGWWEIVDSEPDLGHIVSERVADALPAAWGELADAADRLAAADLGAGTSAATPIVSGIMALGAQINPHMDVRMAKHLLAKTCKVVDPNDGSAISDDGWKTDGAGYHFDQNYGFGLIDADAFTLEAAKYVGVTPEVAHPSGLVTVNAAIPDAGYIARTFTLDGTGEIEVLEVALDITHPWRGHLEAFLTSPSGLRSRLFYRNGADSFQDIDWTFTTNAFWGEGPAGTWSLDVYDVYSGHTGTWNNFAVTAYTGELILPEPAALALLAMGAIVALRRRRTTR